MEEKLNNQFVIYISKQNNKLTGVELKSLKNGNGMSVTELDEK